MDIKILRALMEIRELCLNSPNGSAKESKIISICDDIIGDLK